MEKRGLPIGIQTFEKIVQGDQIYVDKTELICQLINGSGAYFLSRPRRFGKSLLISTMEAKDYPFYSIQYHVEKNLFDY